MKPKQHPPSNVDGTTYIEPPPPPSRKAPAKNPAAAKALAEATAKATAKAAKKPAAKKEATSKKKAKAAKPKVASVGIAKPEKRVELDPSKLDPKASAKRLRAIYQLQAEVDTKTATYEAASRVRRAAKADLEEALEALAIEVHDQRFGPGPLFNADGSNAAGKPTRNLANIGVDEDEADEPFTFGGGIE